MHIRVSGKPKKIDPKLCKEAAHFYGKILLPKRINHNVTVKIHFKKLPSYEYAYCGWDWDADDFKRDFIITVADNLTRKDTLTTIAHEMVHIKQYARGELRQYSCSNKMNWLGTRYNTSQANYWDLPWEIEAYGKEFGLYVRFIQSKKEKARGRSK